MPAQTELKQLRLGFSEKLTAQENTMLREKQALEESSAAEVSAMSMEVQLLHSCFWLRWSELHLLSWPGRLKA